MRVSELYNDGPFKGRDVWIIGTGPSLSVMPPGYLDKKCCLLLNDCQRFMPDLGPFAFSNNLKFLEDCNLPYQIVKARLRFDPNPERDDNHCSWEHPSYYCFSYRQPPWDKTSHFDESQLWAEPDHYWNTRGGSVVIFAMQFALLCRVRSIQLVGCDCCNLGKQEYLNSKKGRRVHHDYDAYARGIMRMIREARERFRVPVVSVTPFPGLGRHNEQFLEMKKWEMNQPESQPK